MAGFLYLFLLQVTLKILKLSRQIRGKTLHYFYFMYFSTLYTSSLIVSLLQAASQFLLLRVCLLHNEEKRNVLKVRKQSQIIGCQRH